MTDPGSDSRSTASRETTAWPAGGSFVGRRRELAEVCAGLDATSTGRGTLFLLVGDAGIGKTRLAEEMSAHARRSGAHVLWGRCWEGGGAPAYWPWIEILRAYRRGADDADVPRLVGLGGASLAALVEELRDRLPPDAAGAVAGDPEQARFALFDAATTFLGRAAARRPLVLVFDDLHVADQPSLLLLQYFARALAEYPILVVGSYRPLEARRQPEVTEILDEIARHGHRIPLRGLASDDVERFIESTFGVRAGHLAEAVHRATDGNPFFVDEILRVLAAEGRLDERAAGPIGIPDGVRGAIRRRLGPVSADCANLLAVAAVAGREFHVGDLERAGGVSARQILDLIGEAINAGILSGIPLMPARYRFSHILIRDTLYDDLPPARRADLHRALGESMEEVYRDDLDPHVAALARHFVAATPAGSVEKAIEYSIAAGDRAAGQVAYEEAARHYECALDMLAQRAGNDERRCRLLLALGEARNASGEIDRAKEALALAGDIAARLALAEPLARAALAYGGPWALMFSPAAIADPVLVDLLERALAALGQSDGALRAKVLARLANKLYYVGAPERAARLSEDAVAMAERIDDRAALASALYARHTVSWGPEHLGHRLRDAATIIRLADEARDPDLALRGRFLLIEDLLAAGRVSEVDREIAAYQRLADETRGPFENWFAILYRAMRALLDGRLDDGERLAGDALQFGQQVQGRQAAAENAVQAYSVQTFCVLLERGDLAMVEPGLRMLAAQYPMVPGWRCALARLHCAAGDEVETRRQFDVVAANDFADLPRDAGWLAAMGLLSETCAFLGDARRSELLYALLRPHSGMNIAVDGMLCTGAVDRYLGLLAGTMGRRDVAVEHFDAAVAMNARMGAHTWLAHTRFDYAAVLLAQDGPRDRARGLEMLAVARRTAEQLGMTRLLERATALEGRSPPPAIDMRDAGENVFRREGEYWTICYAGVTVRLRHVRGLACLALLLRHPHREFRASELAGLLDVEGPLADGREDDGGAGHAEGDTGPVLDTRARREYEERVAELRAQLEQETDFADPARIVEVMEQVDFLGRELGRGIGAGGRARRTGSPTERARLKVTKAIRTAIARIASQHRALGRHLDGTIRTGTSCRYVPDREPVAWT